MSCLGCSSSEEPICARCAAILREQEKKMTDKFDELTPKELGYMMALAGLLASSGEARRFQYDVVNDAIKIVDLLFERIEQQRKQQ